MSGEPDLREPLDVTSRTQPLLAVDATDGVESQFNPIQTSSRASNERPDATDAVDCVDSQSSSLNSALQTSSLASNERADSFLPVARASVRQDHTRDRGRTETVVERPLDEDKDLEVGEEDPRERICAVCMELRINTVFLPCRHSATCEACATTICGTTNKCPICRASIQQFRLGEFESSFVDFASRAVERVRVRVRRANDSAYEGMYKNISYFMLTALVILVAAILVFIFSPLTWVAHGLAGLALLVGYLPWFIVTVNAFETIDTTEETEDGVRLLSCDWSHPCRVIFKIIMMIVLAPFALAIFFIPYGIFWIIRSFFKDFLPFLALLFGRFLVSAFCWGCLGTAVATRPVRTYVYTDVYMPTREGCRRACRAIGSGCHRCSRALMNGISACCGAVRRGLQCCCSAIVDGIGLAAGCVYQFVLVPIGFCFRAVGLGLYLCLSTCWRGIVSAATVVNTYVFTPIGQCLTSCFVAVGHGLQRCFRAIGDVISAIGRGIWCCLSTCAGGIAAAATRFYEYVLTPIGQCFYSCLNAIGRGLLCCFRAIVSCIASSFRAIVDGITAVAMGVYTYCLTPIGKCLASSFRAIGQCIASCFRAIVNGITAGAMGVYTYCLTPIGKCLASCFRAIGKCIASCFRAIVNGITAGAMAVYTYCLTPIGTCLASCFRSIGQCIASCFRAIVNGITAVAMAVYTYCLTPIGKCVTSCFRAIGRCIASFFLAIVNGITAGAMGVYAYVLTPIGQCFYACFRAVGHAISAFVSYVGRGISLCISSVRSIFQAFIRWVLQVCQSIGGSIRSCFRSVRGVRVF